MALRIIIIFVFIFSTNIIFGQNLWQLQRGTETGQVPMTQGQHHIMEFVNLADYVADSLGLVQTQLEMRGDSICVVGGNCVMDVDPVFMGHLSYNITAADTARWGDHFSGLFTDLDFTGTVGMSDGVDNVDDADNNPTNELQTLNISGYEISISNGNTITIPAGSDDQAISLSGNILTLEDGGTVDLSPYLDNTDDQILSISNDTIFLENGGFIVLPEDQFDDADNNPSNEIQNLQSVTDEGYVTNNPIKFKNSDPQGGHTYELATEMVNGTGMVVITFPAGLTSPNINMEVSLTSYFIGGGQNRTIRYLIYGKMSSPQGWSSQRLAAAAYGASGEEFPRVRFAKDSLDRQVVLIGDTTSLFRYTNVTISTLENFNTTQGINSATITLEQSEAQYSYIYTTKLNQNMDVDLLDGQHGEHYIQEIFKVGDTIRLSETGYYVTDTYRNAIGGKNVIPDGNFKEGGASRAWDFIGAGGRTESIVMQDGRARVTSYSGSNAPIFTYYFEGLKPGVPYTVSYMTSWHTTHELGNHINANFHGLDRIKLNDSTYVHYNRFTPTDSTGLIRNYLNNAAPSVEYWFDWVQCQEGDYPTMFHHAPEDLLDNTDDQILTINEDTLSIEDGNAVVLPFFSGNFTDLDFAGTSGLSDGVDDTGGRLDSVWFSMDTLYIQYTDVDSISTIQKTFLNITGDQWGQQVVQTLGAYWTGNGTTGSPLEVSFPDDSNTNEIQVISLSNDTIYLQSGGFIVLPEDMVDDDDNDPTNEVDIYKSTSFSTIVAEPGKWRWITGDQGSPDSKDYIGFSIPDHGLAANHMAQLAWRDKDFFWRTAEDSNLNPWKRVYTEWDFSESDILNWEAAYNWGDHSTQGYLDNTDDQQLILGYDNVLTLEDGGTVDLSPFLDNTDDQVISISNNILTLEDGGTVDLTPYLDNTDDQILSISNDTLFLENGGFVVLPESAVDDADADPTNEIQELYKVGLYEIGITGGNSIFIPEQQEIELQQDTLLTLSDAYNKINISTWLEDDQAISISNNILTLEDGGTVDLTPYLDNTDDQAISISNDTLFLENGGFVVLPAGGGGSASDFVVNGIEYTDGDTINTFLYNDEYRETIFDHIRQPYYTTDNPNEVLKNGNRLEITDVDTTLKRFKINRDLNTMDLTRGVNNRNWHFVSRTTYSGGQLGSIHGEIIDVDYVGGYLYYDTYYPPAGTGHPTVGHYVELINPFINYEITHNEQAVFPQIEKGESFQGRTVDYNIPATTQRLDDNSFVTVVDVRFTNGDSEGYLARSPDGIHWTLTDTVLYDNSVYPGISMNEIVKIPNDQGAYSGKYLCIMRMDPVDFGGYMIFDADFTQEVGLTEFQLNQANEFNLFRPTLRAAVFHEGKIRFAMLDLESNKADRKIIEYIYEGKLDRILSGAADESEFESQVILNMNDSSNPDMTNGVHDIYGYLTDGDKLVLTTGYETWAGLIHHQKRMFVGLILSEDGTWKFPHSPYLVTSPILYRLLDQHRGTTEYIDFEDRMGMGEIFKKGDDYFCFATMSSVQTNDYQSFLLRLTPPDVQVLTKRGDTIGISYGNEIVLNDDDPENELQVLNLSNDTLYISGGNSIVLPAGGGGGFSGLYEDLDFAGTSGLSDGVDDVNDADSNPTNEIQTVSSSASGTNRTISLSGSNGTTFSIADNDNNSSNEMQNLSLNGNTLSISGGNSVSLPTGGAGTDLSNSISGDLVTIQSSTGNNTTFSRADGDSDAGNELSNLQVFTFSGNPRLFDSNGDGSGVDFIGLGGLSLSTSGNDVFFDASGIGGGGGDFSAQMVSGQARVYNTNGDDFLLDNGDGLTVSASGNTVLYSLDRVNALYNLAATYVTNGSTEILDISSTSFADDITISAFNDTFTPTKSGVYKIEVRQLNPNLTFSVRYDSNNGVLDTVEDTDNAVFYVSVAGGTALHIAAINSTGTSQDITIGSAKVHVELLQPAF